MLSDEIKRYKDEHLEGLQEQTICGCSSSTEYARIKRMKEKAAKAIERKFGDDAEEEAMLDVNQRELLKEIACAVADDAIDKASVTISAFRRQIKVTFSVGSKSNIKIEKIITKKEVEEV